MPFYDYDNSYFKREKEIKGEGKSNSNLGYSLILEYRGEDLSPNSVVRQVPG